MNHRNTFLRTGISALGTLYLCLSYIIVVAWHTNHNLTLIVTGISLAIMTGSSVWLLAQALRLAR